MSRWHSSLTPTLAAWAIGLCLLGRLLTPLARADDVSDDEFAQPDRVVGKAATLTAGQILASERFFEQIIFGGTKNGESSARVTLDQLALGKIDRLDQVCQLSDAQRQKLRTAAHGDIERLFRQVDTLRWKFCDCYSEQGCATARVKYAADISEIREALSVGPFGPKSLYGRLESSLLTPQQSATRARVVGHLARSAKTITSANARELQPAFRLPKSVVDCSWSGDGQHFICLEGDGHVELLSPDRLEHQVSVGVGRQFVSVDMSAGDRLLALGDNSQRAFVIDPVHRREFVLASENSQPVVRFSPDGKLLAIGGVGLRVALHSVGTDGPLRYFAARDKGRLTPEFSPNGQILAVGNRNSTTRLFDVASGKMLHELPTRMSHELKFDPTGKILAVAYFNGNLALWNVETGKVIKRANTPAKQLFSVAWAPDGQLLATAGQQGAVTLWDAKDLRPVATLDSPESVRCVRFNPAGTHLVFAGGAAADGASHFIEIWAVP
ncbi:MAG: hypothetical protein JSS02_05015 [Planctomycetes bacterium]|nr:hypothetical protein [Planctomycetota bacterium]